MSVTRLGGSGSRASRGNGGGPRDRESHTTQPLAAVSIGWRSQGQHIRASVRRGRPADALVRLWLSMVHEVRQSGIVDDGAALPQLPVDGGFTVQ